MAAGQPVHRMCRVSDDEPRVTTTFGIALAVLGTLIGALLVTIAIIVARAVTG